MKRACLALALAAGVWMAGGCSKSEEGSGAGTAPGEKAAPAAAEGGKINILWAKWAPANALQELGDEYKKQTGVAVDVDQKDWNGGFQAAKDQEFNTGGDTYDIIIGDSQWIGQGAKGGHYADLTEFVNSNPELFQDVAPAAMQNYAEFPKGSKKYFAIPCESDALAMAYRKDLFEDPKHVEGFKKFLADNGQKDFALGVPQTWEQVLWIAKYFKEASGIPNMAGIVMPTAPGYDQATMSFEPILWSFGGDWGDQMKNTVTIDTPEAVQALGFMKKLVGASAAQGANLDYGPVASAYTSGNAAMAMTFFAFFPTFASPKDDPDYAAKTGYFNVPAGPKGRFTGLGGQGMSLNNHIDSPRKVRAKAFMKWFSKPETQTTWAKKGGFSANTKVLASDDFKNAAPYNPLFGDAFNMMKDFWNVPAYDQLLKASQSEISKVLQADGAGDAEGAIKSMQVRQAKALGQGG